MTLIMGMSKPDGVYLSTDFRVTDRRGRLIDDQENKFLHVEYPPLGGGPQALLAYTGAARIVGVPTLHWIRETIRGEPDVIDVSMRHLRDRLNRDAGHLRTPLWINALIVHGVKRYFVALSNASVEGDSQAISKFDYMATEISQPWAFVNGSGAPLVMDRHKDVLKRHLDIRPRSPADHMKLLATINRRVSSGAATVSPSCQVAFLADGGIGGAQSQVFAAAGETPPFAMASVMVGLDLTDYSAAFTQWAEARHRGEQPEWDPSKAFNGGNTRRR